MYFNISYGVSIQIYFRLILKPSILRKRAEKKQSTGKVPHWEIQGVVLTWKHDLYIVYELIGISFTTGEFYGP